MYQQEYKKAIHKPQSAKVRKKKLKEDKSSLKVIMKEKPRETHRMKLPKGDQTQKH